jgi:hypothetical protein
MIAKKTLLLLLTVAATLAIPFAAHANDIEAGSEFQTAYPAVNPIVLDGNLSEWGTAGAADNPKFAIPKGSGNGGTLVVFETLGGDWTGPDDQSTSLRVAYDADNVYLGLIVTDDYHENAANSAWNGDSVQIHFANAARDTQVALYNYALGGVEGNIGSVIVNEEAGPGGTQAAVTRVAPLTTYEILLPKASLGLADLAPGVQLGIGMAVNDGDELTPGQQGWGGLGPHAVVFGKSPSETALFTLGVPEPSSLVLAMMAIGALLPRRRKTSAA